MKNTYQRKIAALIPDCHFWSSRVVARIPPVVNPNLFRLLSCTHADILILLYAVTSNSSAHTMINQGENASNKKENTKTIKHIRHVKRCLYCVRSIANLVSSRLEIPEMHVLACGASCRRRLLLFRHRWCYLCFVAAGAFFHMPRSNFGPSSARLSTPQFLLTPHKHLFLLEPKTV